MHPEDGLNSVAYTIGDSSGVQVKTRICIAGGPDELMVLWRRERKVKYFAKV
jgi:hypothetical protein